jgi:RHS repeat-associated protein
VSQTGPYAASNLWCFSTKLLDPTWNVVWYEYRPYSPQLRIWPSRDPIGEGGGVCLYRYVGNCAMNQFDPFGLFWGCSRAPDPWEDVPSVPQKCKEGYQQYTGLAGRLPGAKVMYQCLHIYTKKQRRVGADLNEKGCCVNAVDERWVVDRNVPAGEKVPEEDIAGTDAGDVLAYCKRVHPCPVVPATPTPVPPAPAPAPAAPPSRP